MKGRFLSVLLILIISVLGLSACNVVKDKTYDATSSEYFEFTQREDGNYVLLSVKANATLPEKIRLPKEHDGKAVVGIEPRAFKNNQTITEVIIPVGYETIGFEAFASCKKLRSLNVAQFGGSQGGDVSIGYAAFKDCETLTTVTLGENVKVIGDWAFYGTLITRLDSRGLTKVGNLAFGNCLALKDFYVPATLVDIHEDAFKGSKNVSFRVSDSNSKYTVKDGELVSK